MRRGNSAIAGVERSMMEQLHEAAVVAPSAHSVGSLEALPFAGLLVRALDHRSTGTLVLEERNGGRHGVYLEAGTPRKARTASGVVPLGEVLVDAGTISSDVCRRTVERALKEHQLHGQVLLAEGLISERALGLGLREQLLRQVLWLFERPPDTRFAYFDGTNLLEDWGAEPGARLSAIDVIWRGLRDRVRVVEIEAVLAGLGDRQIVLREDMPLDYFFFMGNDREMVELLRARPQRVGDFLRSEPALAELLKRVLCFLVLTRSVDLGVRSAPPLGVDANLAGTPWTVPRLPNLPDLSEDFDFSGSEPETSESAAPDELDADDLVAPASIVPPPPFETDAPVAREGAADEEHVAPAAVERSASQRAFDGLSAFQRAEQLFARGEVLAAEREVEIALAHEPSRAEAVAFNAWLQALKPEPDTGKVALELKRALRLSEHNVKVHWYHGLTLKRLGHHSLALREFRYVVERDPRHIDAAREVRLYELRPENRAKNRASLAPDSSPKSLFSWLRKR